MRLEKDFQKNVDLFEKAFWGTLSTDEKEWFETLLREKRWYALYEYMRSGKFVEERREKELEFNPDKAFSNFEFRIEKGGRKISIFKKIISVAAAIIVFISTSLLFILPDDKSEDISSFAANSTIGPGKNKARLYLTDGSMIPLDEESLELKEKGGVNIKYENGEVQYTSLNEVEEITFNELVVPVGGEFYVILDDGTKVWVNSMSSLKYPTKFQGQVREVYLDGEAYFDVVKNKGEFIVHTLSGNVEVLGTSFWVSAYRDEEMSMTLVSGKVRYVGKDTVLLNPGERLAVLKGGNTEKKQVNVMEYVGWKDGRYVFYNRSLGEIMRDLCRWYDVTISYRTPEIERKLFYGDVERYEDINVFLELLEKTEEIHYKIEGRHIEFY